MKKYLLSLIFFISIITQAQIRARFDVAEVTFVDDTTWTLSGTIEDPSGSYTGLSVQTGDKIIMRGYNTDGVTVYDRFRIIGIPSEGINAITVTVRNDLTGGVQNNTGGPLSGSFPIGSPVAMTKLTFKPSWYQCNIDPDYDTGMDNMNLTEMEIKERWQIEIRDDSENSLSLPFYLKSTSTIIYNGTPLRPSQWSGSGTATLLLNVDVRKYDHITLIN